MTAPIEKNTLLAEIAKDYTDFTTLLASLSEEQITTTGVNGTWTVKDNIAHITAWHNWVNDLLREIKGGEKQEYGVDWSDEAVDEVNERVYQQNKLLPLAEVLAQFHTSYQQLLGTVQSMSLEELNTSMPVPSKALAWQIIAGNTYEHYQEHIAIIQDWLTRSGN
jgi:hypothetical protein